MDRKTGLGIICILLSLLSIPVGMYIQYSLLSAIGASSLLWFLFWANIPLAIITVTISKIIEQME